MLHSFTLATIVQFETLRFCRRFLTQAPRDAAKKFYDPKGRQYDQITQAGRSGRQNLIEGCVILLTPSRRIRLSRWNSGVSMSSRRYRSSGLREIEPCGSRMTFPRSYRVGFSSLMLQVGGSSPQIRWAESRKMFMRTHSGFFDWGL